MPANEQKFRGMCRIYQMLTFLYPESHRQKYGELMTQLFRDQCRDAHREKGACGLVTVWRRVSTDLLLTALYEHLGNLHNHLKIMRATKLSILLFIAAIGLSIFTVPVINAGLAPIFLYLATFALLVRAVAEGFRPRTAWISGLAWGLALVVIYGVIMPWWGKMHILYGSAFPQTPMFEVAGAAVFLNLGVTLLKPLFVRVQK